MKISQPCVVMCVFVFLVSTSTFSNAAPVDTVATFHLSGTADVYTGDQFDIGPFDISASSVQNLVSSLEALSSCESFICPLGGPAVHQLTWEANFPFEVILTTIQSDLTETTESIFPYSGFALNAQFVSPETNAIFITDGGTFTGNLSISIGPQDELGGVYPFDDVPTFQACVDSSCLEPLASVPIPAAGYLFTLGLLSMIGVARCRKTRISEE